MLPSTDASRRPARQTARAPLKPAGAENSPYVLKGIDPSSQHATPRLPSGDDAGRTTTWLGYAVVPGLQTTVTPSVIEQP